MDVSEAARNRYSCRRFHADQVPREVLETILAEAQRAPSWCNAQPWRVSVTAGEVTERLREELLQASSTTKPTPDIPPPTDYPDQFGDRRREAGYALYASVGIERSDREARRLQFEENFRLFGAPHALVVSVASTLGPYALVDIGGYVSHLMLASMNQGLGSIALGSLAMFAPTVRSVVDIPEGHDIVCVVCMGYPDDSAPVNSFRTSRADIHDVASWQGHWAQDSRRDS